MFSAPLPFSDRDEIRDPDEPALFARIAETMRATGAAAPRGAGPGGRLSHVKLLGALKGELEVLPDLAPELAQGAFARPRRYPVVARLSHLPAEALDDRGVSSPRGFALKLFGVEGAPLPGHAGGTQDFVLETGAVFNARDPRSFLAAFSTVAVAAPLPAPAKHAVSAVARGANAALGAVGLGSANLDVLGHPRRHPLAEPYYSQAPLRWGDHVAKLGLFPGERLRALAFAADGPDALREAVAGWFAAHGGGWTLAAQLRTDAAAMPVEDARAPWPETLSPYRPVARLVFGPQDPFAPARAAAVEALSFAPSHSLAAHRPLGGIMRARLFVYDALAAERWAIAEPAGPEVVPD